MVKNVLKKNEKRRKNNKGFSLVELIVVIAIMAVLVGVLAPQFIKYVEKSRQSTDMQSVQQLKSSVETDIADNEDVSSVTIAISGSGKTATATITSTSGTETTSTANLKSSGWRGVTYTLDTATGAWIPKYTDTTNKAANSKAPNQNMDEVFSLN